MIELTPDDVEMLAKPEREIVSYIINLVKSQQILKMTDDLLGASITMAIKDQRLSAILKYMNMEVNEHEKR
jgi:hypothetical protein